MLRLRNLAAAAMARLVAVRTARKNRRSVTRLLYWNDHMLRDIGLTRADLHSALAARFLDDPSERLASLQGESRAADRRRRRGR